MEIIRVLLGVALLLAGRRLFWLVVALAGFVAGLSLAPQFLSGQSQWLILILALGIGLIGALIATLLQGLAIFLAGFLAGGYFVTAILSMLGAGPSPTNWLPFLVGGIIGAILVGVLFEWALILLSALAGASLILQVIHTNPTTAVILFLALVIIGILAQASTSRGRPPRRYRRADSRERRT
ncbi:MAG TPA: DUF4203 domain-containing protein [Anaerolineales bacterium]